MPAKNRAAAMRLARRILSRLDDAISHESNQWAKDDLRVAKLTVLYAANGEAMCCAPHVLASYEVLGLHPEKVWPKIQARRKSLGIEEVWGAAPLPKKPPQSVKLWSEKTNATRTVNSRGALQVDSRRLTISVPMAAPSIAALSTNSGDSGSAKERPFFKREELEQFFKTCPLNLISYPEWRTLRGMWIAAGEPFGSEIQFFKAIKHYAEAAPYKSEAQVRANIRRAEDKGFLEVAYRDPVRGNCHHIWIRQRTDSDRGLYRRVTTHRLSIPLLLKWRAQHHKVREMPTRKEPDPTPPPKAPAPVRREEPQRKTAEHRGTRRVTRDERLALFNTYMALKKTGMRHEKAITEVKRRFKDRFDAEEIDHAVKIVGHKEYGDDVTQGWVTDKPESVDLELCMECGTALQQNKGPGPRLICPQCSRE